MSEPRQLLADDHEAVGEVLQQLLTALNNNDLQASHAKLDLLWARLAVHIRAEHLHLFPAIAARVSEAGPVIENLCADHDFFMRELAQAIGVLREGSFTSVLDSVGEVEKRLASHNEIEEKQVYYWVGSVLTDSEQTASYHAAIETRNLRPQRGTISANDFANTLRLLCFFVAMKPTFHAAFECGVVCGSPISVFLRMRDPGANINSGSTAEINIKIAITCSGR